ncbi:hypothetical protein FSB84_00010 [Pseudobacter ginsenosidimutans]|uniref:hypothetical protein n=1 Tax=Pseudobacter ginsenosidimutans TaxID=661488 RepID=UPI0011BB80F2|nr:hypothetical protein [Pseudobacter ginsenosidimutans]QEC40161.1 hypothetical protein FSB84_00010 [Pseudobacter ginsenosidimutans]
MRIMVGFTCRSRKWRSSELLDARESSNDFPRPRTTSSFAALLYSSTLQYVDGSFLKIRAITVGYTLPKTFTSRFGVSGSGSMPVAETFSLSQKWTIMMWNAEEVSSTR